MQPLNSDSLYPRIAQELRTTGAWAESEIKGIIASALADLEYSGVDLKACEQDERAALVYRAVAVYARAQFGMDNPDFTRLMKAFKAMEVELMAMAHMSREKWGVPHAL